MMILSKFDYHPRLTGYYILLIEPSYAKCGEPIKINIKLAVEIKPLQEHYQSMEDI